jgi:DNA polymerase I-like protein with 3'-5' exonuclease and polymerase domains
MKVLKPSEILPDLEGLYVAVDTETSGLFVDDGARVSIVSVAWRESGQPRLGAGIVTYAFPFDQGRYAEKTGTTESAFDVDYNLDQTEWEFLLQWLTKHNLIMHNAKFDLHMLRTGTRHWTGVNLVDQVIWDTQVTHNLFEPLLTSSLKPTSARLFGEDVVQESRDIQNALRKQGTGLTKRYDLVDWSIVGPYAAQDTALTLRLYEWQQRRLETDDQHLGVLAQREVDLMKVLYKMETRGIGFDAERAEQSASKLRALKIKLQEQLPFKPTLPAAKQYYFGDLGLIPSKVGASGAPSLDNETIKKLAKKNTPHAETFLRWTEVKSALEKWYDNWGSMVGPDGRLRTSFRQTKVVSGRLSVERVQLQAIPHDYQLNQLFGEGVEGVRAFFQPKEGHQLWEIDISQAEIRVATAVAHCQNMRDRLEAGQDAHDATTQLVFGIEKDDPEWDKYRSVGKRLTFGMLYGAGVRTTREQIKLYTGVDASEGQVREWVEAYRTAFPEFVQAARYADNAVQKRGYVRLITGRLRHWGLDEQGHKAFNAVIQGGVAETMKIAMIEVETRFPDILLLQIHDSMVIEVPDAVAQSVVIQVRDTLTQIFESMFNIEFKADYKQWAK